MFCYISILGKLYDIIIYTPSFISYTKDIKAFARRKIPLNNRTR